MSKHQFGRRDLLKVMAAVTVSSGISCPIRAAGAEPLNFGFQNNAWASVGIVAAKKNFFEKFGVDVKVYPFDSGKAVRDAMISGRIDIGVMGATPFLVGASKGSMVAIGMAMYSAKTDSIVIGANSKIASVSELRGLKIGTQIGSETDYVFQSKILPRYQLKPSDVQLINIPFPNHISAMASGSIDAFAGVEPYPSIAEVEKLGRVLIDYAEFDMLPVVLAANRSVTQNRKGDLVKFMKAWLKAADYFKSDEADAGQVIFNYFTGLGFQVKPEVIRLMASKLDINAAFVPELMPYLKKGAASLKDERKISALPDFNTLLNDEFLLSAAKP